jgi:hypothetical protein
MRNRGPVINMQSYFCSPPIAHELFGMQGAYSANSSHFQLSFIDCSDKCADEEESEKFFKSNLLTMYATNSYLSANKTLPSFGNTANESRINTLVK